MEILQTEELSFRYPLSEKQALSSISLSVPEGSFTVICGATGSGKSTLLRLLKREVAPVGTTQGKIFYKEQELRNVSDTVTAFEIGFVAQNPEMQIVTDKVWHELAFGAESMGLSKKEIALRVAEIASYFGIESWYDRDVNTLSGGQKQLLNLASVLVTDPKVLLLDEPTAQLDPIAAGEFTSILRKICTDFSLTVVIAEHHLEDLFPLADRVIVLQNGRLFREGTPEEVISSVTENDPLFGYLPLPARFYLHARGKGRCPLTVRQGRDYLCKTVGNTVRSLLKSPAAMPGKALLQMDNVYFRYGKERQDVLKNLNLTLYENEIFCLLGGNGSGKTTALTVMAGVNVPYAGTVRLKGKKYKEYKNGALYSGLLAMLPQDVQTLFLRPTVAQELSDAGVDPALLPFDVSDMLKSHPYDLSGGQQQIAGLCKILARDPELLLLDEPTKGMDCQKKAQLVSILKTLKEKGKTVCIVTHDLEFAAQCADRCALFFGGKIVSEGAPVEFFGQNRFYTTAAARMTREYYDDIVTEEQLFAVCAANGLPDGEGVC